MNMNINEKKALYAFDCPKRETTVERLRFTAALAFRFCGKEAVLYSGSQAE